MFLGCSRCGGATFEQRHDPSVVWDIEGRVRQGREFPLTPKCVRIPIRLDEPVSLVGSPSWWRIAVGQQGVGPGFGEDQSGNSVGVPSGYQGEGPAGAGRADERGSRDLGVVEHRDECRHCRNRPATETGLYREVGEERVVFTARLAGDG
jgi:hypothetical protein